METREKCAKGVKKESHKSPLPPCNKSNELMTHTTQCVYSQTNNHSLARAVNQLDKSRVKAALIDKDIIMII
jgi:hypothetical protein